MALYCDVGISMRMTVPNMLPANSVTRDCRVAWERLSAFPRLLAMTIGGHSGTFLQL
jgi:hypothetical protein